MGIFYLKEPSKMKTQNTLENKARFFAQYWGQKVLLYQDDEVPEMMVYPVTVSAPFMSILSKENHYLILASLEQISDYDAEQVAKIIMTEPDFIGQELNKTDVINQMGYVVKLRCSCDYLRSNGYLLPYLDISEQDLIDYGWVKLKT